MGLVAWLSKCAVRYHFVDNHFVHLNHLNHRLLGVVVISEAAQNVCSSKPGAAEREHESMVLAIET